MLKRSSMLAHHTCGYAMIAAAIIGALAAVGSVCGCSGCGGGVAPDDASSDSARDSPASDAETPDAGALDLDAVCQDVLRAEWAAWGSCLGWSQGTIDSGIASIGCGYTRARLAGSLERGAATLDMNALARCLTEWRASASACDLLFELDVTLGAPSPLQAIIDCGALVGAVPVGGACRTHWECASDGNCTIGAAGCDGVCGSPATVGEDCSSTECETNLVCSRLSTPPVCVTGPDVPCASDFDCVDVAPRVCDTTTCVLPQQMGDSCSSTLRCAHDLACVAVSGGTAMCSAPGMLGASCVPDSCQSPDLYCAGAMTDASGAVTALGSCATRSMVGEPCDSQPPCAVGLMCAMGACAVRGGVGAPCTERGLWFEPSGDCADGLTCLARRCAPVRLLGETCDGTSVCFAFLRCSGGICVGPAADGAACPGSATQCDSGACVGGLCAPPFCS